VAIVRTDVSEKISPQELFHGITTVGSYHPKEPSRWSDMFSETSVLTTATRFRVPIFYYYYYYYYYYYFMPPKSYARFGAYPNIYKKTVIKIVTMNTSIK
jgi:restriction endonuclease S subunit